MSCTQPNASLKSTKAILCQVYPALPSPVHSLSLFWFRLDCRPKTMCRPHHLRLPYLSTNYWTTEAMDDAWWQDNIKHQKKTFLHVHRRALITLNNFLPRLLWVSAANWWQWQNSYPQMPLLAYNHITTAEYNKTKRIRSLWQRFQWFQERSISKVSLT